MIECLPYVIVNYQVVVLMLRNESCQARMCSSWLVKRKLSTKATLGHKTWPL